MSSMQNSNAIRLPHVFMFLAILISGCATQLPNLDESLRMTKVRIEEVKKDKTLGHDGAQNLYEAELYWQRAWHARRDPAEARHLLFMAQGKIAVAKSIAALTKAEAQLASKGNVPTEDNRKRRTAARPDKLDASGPATPRTSNGDTADIKTSVSHIKSEQRIAVASEIVAPEESEGPVTDSAQAAPVPAQIVGMNSQHGADRADPAPAAVPAPLPASQTGTEIGPTEDDSAPGSETGPAIQTSSENSQAPAKTVDKNRREVEPLVQAANTKPSPPEPWRRQPEEGEDVDTPDRAQDPAKLGSPATKAANDTQGGRTQIAKSTNKDRRDVEPVEQATNTKPTLPEQSRQQPLEGKDIATPDRAQDPAKLDSPATTAAIDSQGGRTQIAKSTNKDRSQFFSNIPEYCLSITRLISGGKKVEQKCIDLELAAKNRLQRVQSHTAIYDYCGGVARALGAGYQILEMCMEQELGSRPDNNETPQGFVMKNGEKNTR